jgi:hypothetical protein
MDFPCPWCQQAIDVQARRRPATVVIQPPTGTLQTGDPWTPIRLVVVIGATGQLRLGGTAGPVSIARKPAAALLEIGL